MLFSSSTPGPPLSDDVEYLWSLSDAPSHQRERIVPTGTLELVINLAEDELRIYDPFDTNRCRRFPGAIVSGAYQRFFVIDTREHSSVIGVHFRPGRAASILGVPPGQLSDTHVDLAALWGRAARELRERLCSARTLSQRFLLLERALLRARRPRELRSPLSFAIDRLQAGKRVGEVASDLALSRRRFIEIFSADVGMRPKLFARVLRFQRSMSLALAGSTPDWAALALECGYFDQSHLIRDFVAFSGFSPVELVNRSGSDLKGSHVALRDPTRSNSSNTPASPRPTLPAKRTRDDSTS
jgi:AraC-like DNA-binding protein